MIIFSILTWILVLGGPGSTFTSPEELFQFVGKTEKTPGVPDTYCTICQKRFPGRAAVRNHVESVHFPGMFNYPCHTCHKILYSKSALNTHITTTHNKKHWINCQRFFVCFSHFSLFWCLAGQISSVEDFDKFMEKEPETSGYFCNICQMYR